MKLEDFFIKLAEAFQTEPEQIRLDSTSDSIEGWDSMGSINLMMLLQDDFDISLSMDELGDINKVADIIDILGQKGVKLAS